MKMISPSVSSLCSAFEEEHEEDEDDFEGAFLMSQSETKVDVSVEERSLQLFKSERYEDLVAIGVAALLVLAVLLGVRV
jgi:hypothetical protein